MLHQKVGFVGAGQMALALAQGLVGSNLVTADKVLAHDPDTRAAEAFAAELPSASFLASNAAVVEQAQLVVFAVKPQVLPSVLAALPQQETDERLFVSVVAGATLETLSEGLGSERVIRVMPNTPCLVGAGAAGYALGPGATAEDGQDVGRILSSIGMSFEVPERLLDAVTGLSGSGPAYVFAMIEALSDGGVRMGLPRPMSTSLAAQTLLGAAKMILATGEHPGVLKDRVTSPGGTTIAGLQVLERCGVRAALIDAVEAAANRAAELGRTT